MSDVLVQLILGGFGISGLIGAGVALFKLRPDVNSAAVTQAEGAMDSMAKSLQQAEDERDYWRKEALELRAQLNARQ